MDSRGNTTAKTLCQSASWRIRANRCTRGVLCEAPAGEACSMCTLLMQASRAPRASREHLHWRFRHLLPYARSSHGVTGHNAAVPTGIRCSLGHGKVRVHTRRRPLGMPHLLCGALRRTPPAGGPPAIDAGGAFSAGKAQRSPHGGRLVGDSPRNGAWVTWSDTETLRGHCPPSGGLLHTVARGERCCRCWRLPRDACGCGRMRPRDVCT